MERLFFGVLYTEPRLDDTAEYREDALLKLAAIVIRVTFARICKDRPQEREALESWTEGQGTSSWIPRSWQEDWTPTPAEARAPALDVNNQLDEDVVEVPGREVYGKSQDLAE